MPAIVVVVLLIFCSEAARPQVLPLPLTKAIQATELPLGAWGCYSRTHSGPCYLADRFPQQLYSFPIVVGQCRTETIREVRVQPDGKKRLSSRDVVLRRRSIGLGPILADSDDIAPTGVTGVFHRRARVVDADADGYLWRHEVRFGTAGAAQRIVGLPDESGVPNKGAEWGDGSAVITCLPAFVDSTADGLLIRVEITNRSSSLETWFVDLLGGIETPTEQFLPGDLSIEPRSDTTVIKHAHTNQAFCLGMRSGAPLETGTVAEPYFAESASISTADLHGKSTISGLLNLDNNVQPDPKTSRWGLARADSLSVPAGQTLVVWMCIGVGKDAEAAVLSVRTLLNVAEDSGSRAKAHRTGAYSQAITAHEKAKYASGDPRIDRLMAQSLLNTPCTISRRLGVSSRTAPGGSTYRPDTGGYIALGWDAYRPDWTATQLNAWFATLSDPAAPLSTNHALPSADLFTLWQLFQASGSDTMLKYVYPFARRRYQELVASCRVAEGSWLFAWPLGQPDGQARQTVDPVASPECSARIAVSARILGRVAAIIARPAEEIRGYEDDRMHALEAINRDLWSDTANCYAMRLVSAVKAGSANLRTDMLSGLLPLIAGPGALSDSRLASILSRLKDPADFWSNCGVRSVSRRSPIYRSGERYTGGVEYGTNWLIWQGLIDLGEVDTARLLASNLVNGYLKSTSTSGGLPQFLDGDSGAGCGAMDWSGDAGCIIWLYAAYHVPGTISSGLDIVVLDHHYDAAADQARVVYKPSSDKAKNILQCVMGKAGAEYTVAGDFARTVKSDTSGLVLLDIPQGSGTQQITIAPAGSALK